MLTFAHPWLALLLPLPWLVRRLLPAHHERKAAVRVPFLQRLSSLVGLQPGSGVAVASGGNHTPSMARGTHYQRVTDAGFIGCRGSFGLDGSTGFH